MQYIGHIIYTNNHLTVSNYMVNQHFLPDMLINVYEDANYVTACLPIWRTRDQSLAMPVVVRDLWCLCEWVCEYLPEGEKKLYYHVGS